MFIEMGLLCFLLVVDLYVIFQSVLSDISVFVFHFFVYYSGQTKFLICLMDSGMIYFYFAIINPNQNVANFICWNSWIIMVPSKADVSCVNSNLVGCKTTGINGYQNNNNWDEAKCVLQKYNNIPARIMQVRELYLDNKQILYIVNFNDGTRCISISFL